VLGDLQGEGDGSDTEEIHQLQGEVNKLIELEELKWQQMARQDWLKHGDKNSKYFHAHVNQRRKHNLIKQITDVEGLVCIEQQDIERALCVTISIYFGLIYPREWSDVSWVCLEKLPVK
jgi:hypothetical protein